MEFLKFRIKYKGEFKMEVFLNTANPIIILIYTVITILVIFVSKKSEKAIYIIFLIIAIVGLLVFHSLKLDNLNSGNEEMISQTYYCIAFDLVILLVGFIGYLWIDDIVAKKKKLKSYDDILSWFWNKI